MFLKVTKKQGFTLFMENPFFEKPQSPLPSLTVFSVKGMQGQAGFTINCTSVKGTFILAIF